MGNGIITKVLAHAGHGWQRMLGLGVRPKSTFITGDGDPVYELAVQSLTSGLDHQKLSSLINQAHDGALDVGLQLCEDMERLDPNLMSVCNTRRRALTALEWEVQSAADSAQGNVNKAEADEAAEYVRDVLGAMDCFGGFLRHGATAIGRNLAVSEIVWDGIRPVDLIPVAPQRLVMDPSIPGLVRVRTRDHATGYPALPPDFIVHIPHGSPMQPFRSAPLLTQAREWLMKQIAKADWSKYVNLFGMPIRWAVYEPGATDEEKTKLLRLLETMGRLSYGAFSKGVDLQMKESSQRGTSPHRDLVEWVSKEQAKLMLGGNLTSDTTGGTGTYAAGAVQDEVREDLRDDDIMAEAETIRTQLIAPMVYFKFWRHMPLPTFQRVKPEAVDRLQIAQLIQQAQSIGLAVGEDYARGVLGIPPPADGEQTLEGKPAAPSFAGPIIDVPPREEKKADPKPAGEEETEETDERD